MVSRLVGLELECGEDVVSRIVGWRLGEVDAGVVSVLWEVGLEVVCIDSVVGEVFVITLSQSSVKATPVHVRTTEESPILASSSKDSVRGSSRDPAILAVAPLGS